MGLAAKQKMTVAVLLMGTLVAMFNLTLMAPAIPAIMENMGLEVTTVQWVTSGYSLVEAVVIPLVAFLVGRFNTKKLYLAIVSWFALGCLVVSVAPTFPILMVGRVMQAMSTGVLVPLFLTLIQLIFPIEYRGRAMGIVSLVIGFAPAAGPVLGGIFVDSVGWRPMFAGAAALAALVAVLAFLFFEVDNDFEPASLDAPSVALMAGGMVSLLYGLSSFTSAENLILVTCLIAAGIVLLCLFVKRQLKLDVPMLRVDVCKTRRFLTMVLLLTLLNAAFIGADVLLPIFVQQVLGQNATTTGLVMMPGAAIGAFMGVISGRLFDKYGARKIAVPAALVMVAAAFGLTFYGADTSVVVVCAVFTVLAAVVQFIITPTETWGVNSLDNSVLQHGNSVYITATNVGMSFGTAFVVSLTGLANMIAPAGASEFELLVLGEHIAFIGMAALFALTALGIVVFVRDSRGHAVESTFAEMPASTGLGAQQAQ